MKVLLRPSTTVDGSDLDDPALRDSKRQKGAMQELQPSSLDRSLNRNDVDTTEVSLPEDKLAEISAAKANLKALLLKHNRSAKHPEVEKALEVLQALNTTTDAASSPHLEGCFVSLTRPEFPGRIEQDKENEHIDQYTLGRMSFNIFQPKDLVCTITHTRNIIKRSPQEEKAGESCNSTRTFSYPLETHMTVHTPKGDFPASLQMEAFCSSAKQPKNRLGVTFVGGTMVPGVEVRSDPTKLALWKEVFANAYEKASAERSYLSSIMLYFFKWMFQLTTPTDEEAAQNEDSSVRFEMKRCPHGHIDVLFLDEDMRITRGNRGTVVILERTN